LGPNVWDLLRRITAIFVTSEYVVSMDES
jgi:hypothetical protein